jgi:hypothetical protein
VNVSDERRTVKTRNVTLAAALAVLLLAVAAVASGCGSSSSADDDVAALDETTTTEESTPATAEEEENQTDEDRQEAALEWAKCMREHGIDVPDPEFGADGRGTVRVMGRGIRPDDEKFREAQEACGTPFGRGGPPALSEEERQEFQEAMLEFAQCMREHGVDMPDPEFGDGGHGVFRMGPGPGAGAADTERFEEAQDACQPILEELRERREAETESEGSGS